MNREIAKDEVAQNNTADSLWCIIDSKVYDLTDFADAHPGGATVLYQIAAPELNPLVLGAPIALGGVSYYCAASGTSSRLQTGGSASVAMGRPQVLRETGYELQPSR